MTKLTLEQQELLFANDCKLINLRYEYNSTNMFMLYHHFSSVCGV